MKYIGWVLMGILSVPVLAQDYHVLQVKGSVRKTSGVQVKPGEVISQNDKLAFGSADDAVAVVNPKLGRFIIKPGPAAGNGEFLTMVKDAVTPGIKKLSTRSAVIGNVVDFQTFFQDPWVILDQLVVKVSTVAFPLSPESFFFIRYRLNDEEINKKLKFSGDTIIIFRDELFSVDDAPIDPHQAKEQRLFHFHSGKAHFISNVSLIAPDLNSLRGELQALARSLDRKKFDVAEESKLYITEFYGKVMPYDFTHWYSSTSGTD